MIELSVSTTNLVSSGKGPLSNFLERQSLEKSWLKLEKFQNSGLKNFERARHKVHGNFRLYLSLSTGSAILNIVLILVLQSTVCTLTRCEVLMQKLNDSKNVPIAIHMSNDTGVLEGHWAHLMKHTVIHRNKTPYWHQNKTVFRVWKYGHF